MEKIKLHTPQNNHWDIINNTLYRKFIFLNFSEAISFITLVAAEAEKLNHHPKFTNLYNTVEIWLNTHDAGDTITEKDHLLAANINALVEPL